MINPHPIDLNRLLTQPASNLPSTIVIAFVIDVSLPAYLTNNPISIHPVTFQSQIPINADKAGRVLLAGSFPKFFEEGKKRYPGAGEFRYNYELGPNETQWMKENIVKTAKDYDTIVICVANERSSQIAQTLKDLNKRVIVMSIMTPTHAFKLSWASDILIGYSYSNYTFEAMFAAMNGEISIKGLLPFTEQQ